MRAEERGGYLPVLDVLRAICDEKEGLGYKGWISMELFNRSLVKEDPNVPIEHAERAMKSWRRIVKAMGWEDKIETQMAPRKVVSRVSEKEVENIEISARL